MDYSFGQDIPLKKYKLNLMSVKADKQYPDNWYKEWYPKKILALISLSMAELQQLR